MVERDDSAIPKLTTTGRERERERERETSIVKIVALGPFGSI